MSTKKRLIEKGVKLQAKIRDTECELSQVILTLVSKWCVQCRDNNVAKGEDCVALAGDTYYLYYTPFSVYTGGIHYDIVMMQHDEIYGFMNKNNMRMYWADAPMEEKIRMLDYFKDSI